MTQLSAANAKERPQATSAISLAAITAGAVAAAVVIMSIGSIVTIISIGSSINTGMQTATAMQDDSHILVGAPATVIAGNSYTTDHNHFQQVKKAIKRNEKSFYLDAVLREDSNHLPTPTSEQVIQQPKLTIKGNHVFA